MHNISSPSPAPTPCPSLPLPPMAPMAKELSALTHLGAGIEICLSSIAKRYSFPCMPIGYMDSEGAVSPWGMQMTGGVLSLPYTNMKRKLNERMARDPARPVRGRGGRRRRQRWESKKCVHTRACCRVAPLQ